MKIYRLYENIHENLVNKLRDIIISDKKNINGFDFYFDNMVGSFEWDGSYYEFYATPYWKNNNKLPVNIYNKDGFDIFNLYQEFNLPILNTDNDIKNCIKFYYKKIEQITLLLNNRVELKNNLELIKQNVGNNELKKYFNVEDISTLLNDIDNISDKEVNNLLDIINKNYSHIILSSKYNL